MHKKPVFLAALLGILLVLYLGVARGAEETEDDIVDPEVLTTPEDEAVDEVDLDAMSAVLKSCSVGLSGDACIFDVRATANGTLTVCTKAKRSGQRWRATIAQLNTSGAASSVGTGSTTSCTGLVSRNIVSGVYYEVIVTYERPLPGTFPTSVEVQFAGTGSVTFLQPAPRPRSGGPEEVQSCSQTPASAIAAVDNEPIGCGTIMMCQLNTSGDTDAFTFTAPAGGAVSIKIASSTMNGEMWELFDKNGNFMGWNFGQGEVKLPTTGLYTIKASSVYNESGNYTLSLHKVGG